MYKKANDLVNIEAREFSLPYIFYPPPKGGGLKINVKDELSSFNIDQVISFLVHQGKKISSICAN